MWTGRAFWRVVDTGAVGGFHALKAGHVLFPEVGARFVALARTGRGNRGAVRDPQDVAGSARLWIQVCRTGPPFVPICSGLLACRTARSGACCGAGGGVWCDGTLRLVRNASRGSKWERQDLRCLRVPETWRVESRHAGVMSLCHDAAAGSGVLLSGQANRWPVLAAPMEMPAPVANLDAGAERVGAGGGEGVGETRQGRGIADAT